MYSKCNRVVPADSIFDNRIVSRLPPLFFNLYGEAKKREREAMDMNRGVKT